MCQATLFLDTLLSASDPVPLRQDLHPARYRLVELGYTDVAIREAMRHLGLYGTAQGSAYIDEEDRDAIEALLPMAPAAAWEAYGEHVYGLGAGA
jgi:hypothetical protein